MKILYLPQVSWNWIFQRPQILALMLEKDYECIVLNKKYLFGKKLANYNKQPHKLKNVYLFPKGNRFSIVKKINSIIYSRQIKNLLKKVDAVWICHPSQYQYINNKFKGIIIYDCMDNHEEFSKQNLKKQIKELEEKLIQRSNIIFVSSKYLKDNLKGMEKAVIVRNGFSFSNDYKYNCDIKTKDNYIIGYFGTVSEWFDFDLLLSVKDKVDKIKYKIIGPVNTEIPKEFYDIGTFVGIVEHKKLWEEVKDCDALIMPFILNELILAVDPVKLYEYINFNKCIISVWYPELERFSSFVYFYNSKESYFELLKMLKNNNFKPKYNNEQRKEFLKQNTWDERYKVIKDEIEKFTKGKSI